MKDYKKYLSEEAANNVTKWLEKKKYQEYKPQLLEMIEAEKWQELEDAFFKIIEFGTGGRRGTTGIGSNRINKVTIGESAQALCSYIEKFEPEAKTKGIAVVCDTRLSSPELSRYVAEVVSGNGFKTYVYDGFRSTPQLSFTVRELKCAAGIVISASHNPPMDNGFKAYWTDGGQLVKPHDKGVMAEAEKIEEIVSLDFDKGVESGLITILSSDMDDRYQEAVLRQSESDYRGDLKVVYSPLHGAGQRNSLPVLEKAGFNVITVKEQMVPDGNFPTVKGGKANPEERSANDMAVALMQAEKADIAITNDPDADRIGVMVYGEDGPIYLNGNMSASLDTEYVLSRMHEKGALTDKHYIAKTIVTTDLMQAIANRYGVKTYTNMLIGFKYIGELIKNKEGTDEIFTIGGEESYGVLKGDYVRDKDGAVGALLSAEHAALLKKEGKTLLDKLYEMYETYGIYVEDLRTVMCPGKDGFSLMQKIMQNLRTNPVKEVLGERVTEILDYESLKRKNLDTLEETDIDCYSGNVITLVFGDYRRRITIRPSGTEPKLKFYIQWFKESEGDVKKEYQEVRDLVENLGENLEATLLGE